MSGAGTFAVDAPALVGRGLAALPVRGKRPAVDGWSKWTRPPSRNAIGRWSERFADCNIGIATMASGVTIVDVDSEEPAVRREAEQRFGTSPLVTRTPSGGSHLWYQSSAERNRNLRRSDGMPIDIRGVGGIAVVPSSWNRETGEPYVFECGSWDDVARLPVINPGSLSEPTRNASPAAVKVGERNDALFRSALRMARRCRSIEDLMSRLANENREFEIPLPDGEVVSIANSAWQMQLEDRNWVGDQARCRANASTINELLARPNGADVLSLFMVLQASHSLRGEPFAVSPAAMARDALPWGKDRVRRARDELLKLGYLECVHQGGKRRGDASRYQLSREV